MLASLTSFEGSVLTYMCLGSLALAAVSIVLALILVLRHLYRERDWNVRQLRKEEIRKLIHAFQQAPQWSAPDKILPLSHADLSIALELAVEWLRLLSRQQAEAIVRLLRAWGSAAYIDKVLRQGTRAQKTLALIFCSYETSELTKNILIKYCSENDLNIQIICLRGLSMRGEIDALWMVIKTLNLSELKSTHVLADIFIKLGEVGVSFLVYLSKQKQASIEVRMAAIISLGFIGDIQAVDPLLSFFYDSDEDKNIKAQALLSLGRIGDPRAEGAVIDGLGHSEMAIRVNAVHAAARLKSLRFVEKLSNLLEDPVWWVRFRAGEALSKIEGAGQIALERACQEKNGIACTIIEELKVGKT